MWMGQNAAEHVGIQIHGTKRTGIGAEKRRESCGSSRKEIHFGERMPGLLFFVLYERSHEAPFCSWLRRFLYKRAGFTLPADQVADSE